MTMAEKEMQSAYVCTHKDKIKTSFAKIFVSGTPDRPYFNILYFDPVDQDYHVGFSSYCLEYVFKWLSEEFEIEDAPAADVAPVVHGRWIFGKDLPYIWGQIPKNKYHLYCSECLEQAFNRSEDNDPDFDVDTSYCHNCGAKMDVGNGDEAD